ncbi:oligopeptide/dipeptide ABC transporter ATP-binding protein [Actinomycetospora rhizophila]|uniref:Oligopeptide/dipeptide ABC transporter ATP-binding protein n=1 Tax=Actinomycetospora rhizophila TaxID=1416876 RepID=A0ABV9ZAD2_9PSEU
MSTLEVCGLDVRFRLGRRPPRYVRAVSDVDLDLRPGRLLALVGESGCGKSVLTEALTGLLPSTAEVRGQAVLGDSNQTTDLLDADERTLREKVRGRLIGLVGQSAGSYLTPTRTVGAQLRETVRHLGAGVDVGELAARVQLPAAALELYPHELSGGTAQRVALAAALAGDPPVLLADEPTAGLDRPLVDHTMDLLAATAHEGRAVLVITHDLRAARRAADDLAVMYASRLLETGPIGEVLADPWHTYTAGLVAALPGEGFTPIPGHPPELSALPDGCPFRPRSPEHAATCTDDPRLVPYGERAVACVGDGAQRSSTRAVAR